MCEHFLFCGKWIYLPIHPSLYDTLPLASQLVRSVCDKKVEEKGLKITVTRNT